MPHHNTKRNRTAAGALAIIGAVLLIAALFVGWYQETVSFNVSGFSGTNTGDFYITNKVVTTSTSGGNTNTVTKSYSDAGLNKTGQLAGAIEGIVIAGIILGFIGAILGFGSRGRQSWVRPAMALLVLALLLSIVAPIGMLALQPSAVKSDSNSSLTNGQSGPWNSFFGSCSAGSSCAAGSGGSFTWGPYVGWYLSIVAFVLFLIALIVLSGARKAPPMEQPTTMAGSPAQSAPMMPPSK